MKLPEWSVSLLLLLLFKINFTAGGIEEIDETHDLNLGEKGKTFDETKQHLGDVLKKCNLVPGKNVKLTIEPPKGWESKVTRQIANYLRETLPNLIVAPDTAFEINATSCKDSGFLETIELKISGGFLLSSNVEKTEVKEEKPISLKISTLKDFMFKVKEKVNQSSSLISEINRNQKSHKWITIILEFTQNNNSSLIEQYEAILMQQLREAIEYSHGYTLNRNVLLSKDDNLKHIEFYVEIFPVARLKSFEIKLADGVDPEKVLKRLLTNFVLIETNYTCPPMNVLVTTDGKEKQGVFQHLKNITQNFLGIIIPEKRFSIKYNEIKTDSNKFNLSVEYDNSRMQISRSRNYGVVLDMSYLEALMSQTLKLAFEEILNDIKHELKSKSFVNVSFIMKLTPYVRQSDLSLFRNELLLALKNRLSDCRVQVTATPSVGPYGSFSHVKFEIYVEKKTFVTESTMKDLILFLDTKRRNFINIASQLRMMIINNLPRLLNELQIKQSTTIIFKVSFKTNVVNFLENVRARIMDQLKVYFPQCQANITSKRVGDYNFFHAQLETKDGSSNKDSSSRETITLYINNPGETIGRDLELVLEQKKTLWKGLLRNHQPVTLNFMIYVSQFSGIKFSILAEKIVPIIRKFFPNTILDLHANSELGEVIIVTMVIRRKHDEPQRSLTLENPDIQLDVSRLPPLPQPKPDVHSSEKPKSQYSRMEILSQVYSSTAFKTKIFDRLQKIATRYFKYILISLQAEIKPNIQTSKADFDVISRRGIKYFRDWKTFTLDVDFPTLIPQLEEYLNEKENEAKNDLQKGQAVGFSFVMNTRPSTRLLNLELVRAYILFELLQHIPNNQIYTGICYLKDTPGHFVYAEINVVIQRFNERPHLPYLKKKHSSLMTLDLSELRTSTVVIPKDIVYNLMSVIGNNPKNISTHNVELNIKIPTKSDENTLFFLASRVVDEISKYFPEFYIDSISNTVKSLMGFKDMKLSLFLTPGKSPAVSFSQNSPRIFQMVIPNSKDNLAIQFLQWLQTNSPKFYGELNKAPVILVINMQPPDMSTKEYEMKKLKEIKELLNSLFDTYNLRYEVRAIADQSGYITGMDVVVKIEQKSQPQEDSKSAFPLFTPHPENSGTPIDDNPEWQNPVIPDNIHNRPIPVTTENTWNDIDNLWNKKKSPYTSANRHHPEGIPKMEVAIRPHDDITSILEPFYLKNMFEILDKLKNNLSFKAEFVIDLIGDIRGATKDVLNMIRYSFDRLIGKGKVKLDLDDSSDKLKIKMNIVPSDRKEVRIDLENKDTTNALNQFRGIVDEILKNFIASLQDDEKSGISLDIVKPKYSQDDFIVAAVTTVRQIINDKYPNIKTDWDVAPTGDSGFKIDVQLLKTKSSPKTTDKPLYLQVQIVADGSSFTEQMDKKLGPLVSLLSSFIDKKEKLTLSLDMQIPEQSTNKDSIVRMVDSVKHYLESRIPAASISIRPYWSPTYPNRIRLDVQIQKSPDRGTGYPISFNMDLTNPNRTLNSHLQELSSKIIPVVRNKFYNKEPAILIITIQPPERVKDFFMSDVRDVIIPSLTSNFCGVNKTSESNFEVDLNGYLTSVSVIIVMEPPEELKPEGDPTCEQHIYIDLTKPNVDTKGELDKRFAPSVAEVQLYLEKGKTVTLIFDAVLPSAPTSEYLQTITDYLSEGIQNYFPHNAASVNLKSESSNRGSFLTIKITISPEENPFPAADLDIPLDLSQGIGIKFFVNGVVHIYKRQMKYLISSQKKVIIKFRITPPSGADEAYFEKVTDDVITTIQRTFKYKSIKMQSKAAKNSKGEIFNILIALTLS